MSFGSGPDAGAGAGSADPRDLPGGLLASAADRDAAQAILEAAFAEQRLTQEEFEARVGRAMTARTEADLAQLVRDLPRSATWPGGSGAGSGADARGTTLVSAKGHSCLVTSYNDFNGAAQAVQAALNTHATLAAGLRDAVSRLTTVDNAR